MGRMINYLKTIRNNWKKSLFGTGLLAYGVDYAHDSYRISTMMRAYCEEAVKYGDEPCEIGQLRRITVILNPAANKKKAKKMFEQYCAPILHLAGVFVSVLETEKEGHARELIDEIEPTTDAIVVAGGDGTLSEEKRSLAINLFHQSAGEVAQTTGRISIGVYLVFDVLFQKMRPEDGLIEIHCQNVRGGTKNIAGLKPVEITSITITGLMRSRGEICKIPIGVLPLGQRNLVARALFAEPDQHNVATMASATLAIVKGTVKSLDAFRIEVLNTDPEALNPRPVYGVGSVEWGLRRELRKKTDSFWWLGPMKNIASLVFHGHRYHIGQDNGFIRADVRYSLPCQGCNHCYQYRADLQPETVSRQTSRWWNVLSLQNRRNVGQSTEPCIDYTKIVNEKCVIVETKHIVTSDLRLVSNNLQPTAQNVPKIAINIGPTIRYQGELVTEGLKILNNDPSAIADVIEAKQVEIQPQLSAFEFSQGQNEDSLSIDNEDYEVRPIRVSVLPNSLKVFCK